MGVDIKIEWTKNFLDQYSVWVKGKQIPYTTNNQRARTRGVVYNNREQFEFSLKFKNLQAFI